MLRCVRRRQQGCPVMVEPGRRRILPGRGWAHLPLASSPPPLPPRAQGRRGSTTRACRRHTPSRPHTARLSSRPVRRHRLGRREPLRVATHRRLAPLGARCRRVPAAPPEAGTGPCCAVSQPVEAGSRRSRHAACPNTPPGGQAAGFERAGRLGAAGAPARRPRLRRWTAHRGRLLALGRLSRA